MFVAPRYATDKRSSANSYKQTASARFYEPQRTLFLFIGYFVLFPRQQDGEHGLLDMEAVFGLGEDLVGVGFKDGGGDLLAAMGR